MGFRRSARLISLFVLFTVIGLSLFLFSPLHRHNRLSPQACAFTNLEHSPWSEDLAHAIVIDPPSRTFIIFDVTINTGIALTAVRRAALVRAPPSLPLS
jgi:hypothetical protein